MGQQQELPTAPRRGRENVEQKGRRLLAEGRLTVTVATESTTARAPIQATCRGDSGRLYKLGYDAKMKEWRCDCEARSRCSHIVALQLVTVAPDRGGA